jgi:hypothetical protein
MPLIMDIIMLHDNLGKGVEFMGLESKTYVDPGAPVDDRLL